MLNKEYLPDNKYPLSELADFLSAEIKGDGDVIITGIAPLHRAVEGQISFLENPRYREYLDSTKASAVIVSPEYSQKVDLARTLLIVPNPYVSYAKLTALFSDAPVLKTGIHPSVAIGLNCEIDSSASIAANCVIGDNVKICKNVQINSGSYIGDGSTIGEGTKLYSNVTLYHKVHIGYRVIIHSGAVIGSDGFGMANERGVWIKIHQLGGVVIGDDVEIGANTTIDRGALENTVIEDGVKLDNQVQVAHNVRIGAHTAIAGCVGIAGSTTIGKHCMIGGGVGISGHINICDGVILTARSAIHKSITTRGIYAGAIPAIEHRAWWRILKRLLQIEDLFRRINKLENNANG